jgi:8-oxo-dGTP pyrophosphatase MutT (NUDIX family)
VSTLPGFDPLTVPVSGVDSHLPAVAPQALTPQALRQRFLTPPDWQPEVRAEPQFTDRPSAAAAVLIPLVMRTGGLTVLLTQRTAHLSTHGGQIAFPGGRTDPTDADAHATALREAHEEVGLHPSHVEILGALPTYVTGTAYTITPVLALVAPDAQLTLNPHEVAAAFEVPLAYLMNPAHHRRHTWQVQDQMREWFSMPYDETRADGTAQHRFIWGATAGMLRNVYRFLIASMGSGGESIGKLRLEVKSD